MIEEDTQKDGLDWLRALVWLAIVVVCMTIAATITYYATALVEAL